MNLIKTKQTLPIAIEVLQFLSFSWCQVFIFMQWLKKHYTSPAILLVEYKQIVWLTFFCLFCDIHLINPFVFQISFLNEVFQYCVPNFCFVFHWTISFNVYRILSHFLQFQRGIGWKLSQIKHQIRGFHHSLTLNVLNEQIGLI